jgi:Flp pilus assembly protein TadD
MRGFDIFRKGSIRLKKDLLVGLLLASMTLLLYWPVQSFDFVNIDDHTYVVENLHVQRGLAPDGFRWALTTLSSGSWHPLTWLSHMLDWQFYRSNAGMHHWTNVQIHVACVLVLFWVLKAMTGMLWGSALAAALFAIHPLHVESVAWVSERKDVLSGLLWFATMGAYAGYVNSPGWGRYALVVLSFVLGLMAKPMLVTLPLVLLLLDGWPLARGARAVTVFDRIVKGPVWIRLLAEKVPLLILATAVCVVTCLAQQGSGAIGTLEQYPLGVRAANAMVSYGEYTWKMVWPVELAVFYPYPGMPSAWKIVMAVSFLAAVSAWVIRYARRYPFLPVGWLWYLGTLVPVIGIVQVGSQSLADRYTYLPLVGLFIAAAAGSNAIVERRPEWRTPLIVFFVALLSWHGFLAKAQVETWKDSITLFEHAIRVTEVNPVAHNNVGALVLSFDKRNCESAVPHFLKAIEQKGDYAVPHYNLGVCAVRSGNHEKAIHYFQKAAELDPSSAQPRIELGLLLIQQGRFEAAEADFLQVLRLDPSHEAAHTNLAMIFIHRGRLGDAEAHLRAALRINPRNAEALNNLGLVRMEQGRTDDAIACFMKARELMPGNAAIETNLRIACEKRQKDTLGKGAI